MRLSADVHSARVIIGNAPVCLFFSMNARLMSVHISLSVVSRTKADNYTL